jgi:hypothetical protein
MVKYAFSVLGAGLLALAAVGSAGTAAAGPTADDTVNGLKTEGYTVQLNQTPSANLSACTVSGIKRTPPGLTPPPTSTFPVQLAADRDAAPRR